MTTDPTIWLVARAAGMVAYVLVTASALAGLLLKAKPFGRRVRGSTAMEIHRSLSLAGLGALVLHGAALALDRAVDIRLLDLLVPGTSPYRPFWTALGVVAAWLMLIVIVSFPLRRLIGARTWRRLHWAAYGVFGLATVHGFTSGTDTRQPWATAVYVASVALVAFATTWRVLARPEPTARRAPRTAPEQG